MCCGRPCGPLVHPNGARQLLHFSSGRCKMTTCRCQCPSCMVAVHPVAGFDAERCCKTMFHRFERSRRGSTQIAFFRRITSCNRWIESKECSQCIPDAGGATPRFLTPGQKNPISLNIGHFATRFGKTKCWRGGFPWGHNVI